MQKFITKLLLFVGGLISLTAVFFTFWFLYYTTPPPNISNSISLNSKVLYIKYNSFQPTIDILTIGSSMSLNNINSNTIVNILNNHNYLNVSSWGLNMERIYKLLKIYNERYNPETIIISSNYSDFMSSEQKINYNGINEFLSSNNPILYFFKEGNLRQAILDSRLLSIYKNDNTIYQSLNFDKYGGVNYPSTNFCIDSVRWNGNNLSDCKIDINQYSYLDSISKLCLINSKKFVFVQSPFREGYYARLNNDNLFTINNHIDKINSILDDSNAIFVNALNETWNDSLFVDFTHFNETGSRVYTKYFLKQLKAHARTAMYKNN